MPAIDTVKSAARAFEIVEAFRAERKRLTAAQLGALLDYPRSSLSVLLKSLVAQGYLSYAAHEQSYFPTLKLTHLGDWVPGALFGASEALALLADLRTRTRETVTLTMATGLHMRVLTAFNGTHPIGLQLDEGTQFPMFGSGVGTAWLSTLPDDPIAALHQRARAAAPRGRVPDLPGVLAAVADVRRTGYCAMHDAVLPDTGAIAMPFTAREYGEALVVAVAGLSHRVRANEETIARSLKRCIAAMTTSTDSEIERNQAGSM